MVTNLSCSLQDLLGTEYLDGVCRARAALTGEPEAALRRIASEKVDFYPAEFAARQEALMQQIGQVLCPPAPQSVQTLHGAPTDAFRSAQHQSFAPMSGLGCFRIGEDGRLFFAGKSEHYHIPLGHCFPGYALLENAKRLGIPNATHNNTRGYVTRLLEQTLIEAANGVTAGTAGFEALLSKREPGVLNRVINLETGSLVTEAAFKMMLSRFYTIDGKPAPYAGRIPVFLVMGDNNGGFAAGYHGTTLFAQMLRGLWPELSARAGDTCRIVSVAINDISDFRRAIERWNRAPYKTAGFCHEIILMNYSCIVLQADYLHEVYRLCRQSDTPVLCDEIQSCAWYDTLYLFRRLGLTPDFVSVGKGFPGGNYAASKVLVSGAFDNLDQFGALVTNGQEELASLSYLITIAFLRANAGHIRTTADFIHRRLAALAGAHASLCSGVEGEGYMTALRFLHAEHAAAFCKQMNERCCIDMSAQTNKAGCPPVALMKLPLIVSETMVEALAERMDHTLTELEGRP